MPGSKPSRRDTGGHSARSNGLAALFVNRPGSEHKRKRKLSKRWVLPSERKSGLADLVIYIGTLNSCLLL